MGIGRCDVSLNTLPHRSRALAARMARDRLSLREQLADLDAPRTPCLSVALDYDVGSGDNVETSCVLDDGHLDYHTDGCLLWSDATALPREPEPRPPTRVG